MAPGLRGYPCGKHVIFYRVLSQTNARKPSHLAFTISVAASRPAAPRPIPYFLLLL